MVVDVVVVVGVIGGAWHAKSTTTGFFFSPSQIYSHIKVHGFSVSWRHLLGSPEKALSIFFPLSSPPVLVTHVVYSTTIMA